MNNNQYSTLAEASMELKKRGFNANFKVNQNEKLTDSKWNQFEPSEVKLIEFHRFEGMSDPGDSSIIYALETKSGVKGTLIDSYGADASETISDFMKNVEQDQFEK